VAPSSTLWSAPQLIGRTGCIVMPGCTGLSVASCRTLHATSSLSLLPGSPSVHKISVMPSRLCVSASLYEQAPGSQHTTMWKHPVFCMLLHSQRSLKVHCPEYCRFEVEEAHLPSARIATSGMLTSAFAYLPPMLPMLDTVNVPPAHATVDHLSARPTHRSSR